MYVNCEDDIKKVEEELNNHREKNVKFEKRIKNIEEYNNLKEKYDRQNKLRISLSMAQINEKNVHRGLTKAEELLECVQKAENVSLESCLNVINSDIEEYVSVFFNEGSINMKLVSYKDVKDGDKKFAIDVMITHENEICALDTLSGGEYDRLALALFLSFNNASNKELIMLDECLSSLHAEAIEDIIDLIKMKYSDRLVIMTLHQSNTGMFDSVIEI